MSEPSTKRIFYFVANRMEGCGHRHKTITAATGCMWRLKDRGMKRIAVYRVTTERVA